MSENPPLPECMAELLGLMTSAGWVDASCVQTEKLEVVFTEAGQHALERVSYALTPLGSELSPRHGLPFFMLLWIHNRPDGTTSVG